MTPLTNSDRRYINELKKSAQRYYELFKKAKDQKVKRLSGLAYLRVTREIREMEKKA